MRRTPRDGRHPGCENAPRSPVLSAIICSVCAGRPNYDTNIAPREWKGRLVWVITINEKGEVTDVEVEAAEGASI